ncbi:alpha/beta hydrolase-fold protein [Gammaproteobacteria bacterium]|nr:alpha/beta hydrolase-fold protein [Gammaproteobacteria bacterium]
MIKVSNLCVTLLAAQLLIACGGGGGGSSPSVQQTPTTPVAPPTPAISSNLDSQAQGTINGTINYEDIDRTFILYVPSSYDSSTKQPLVFNFHGYGSNASEQMAYGDMRSQADANGFILVHPEALNDIVGRSYWNIGGWSQSVHDDVKFTENLINLLMDKYSINAERIYSTGMSNGGFFSFHLACNLNASFAAVASVTGSMTYSTFDNCNPRKPTPVMQIHGSLDATVPYKGLDALNMKSIMDVMEYWKVNNECDDYLLSLPGILPGTSSWTETYQYSNCLNGTENIHLYVQGAGHIWPGSIYASVQSPDSSSSIWNFFSKYDINGVIQ